MTVSTVDAYGAPKYGPIGRPPAGLVFHTPEWGDSPTLAHALGCAQWQATSGNTSGGSYHGILGHDAARGGMDNPNAWVMVRSVPWNEAAGGLTSDHTPPSQISPRTGKAGTWDPGRYPWIRQLVTPIAYGDPNRWFHQIALAGRAGWFVQNGYPKGAVTRLAEWVKILEGAYGYDAVLTLHRMWQVDRTDPGPVDLGDLVLAEYERLNSPPPPAEPDYKALYESTLATANAATATVAELKTKIAAAKAALG